MSRRTWMAISLLSAFAAASSLQGGQDIPLRNWPVPGTSGVHTLSTLSDIGGPNPFIAVTPCRVVDTRNPAGPFGGPAFTSGQTRSFTIPSGPCSGIPTNASSFSLNFTVVNMVAGNGFLTAWPTGSAQPLVSTLDYVQSDVAIANAALVPAGTGGAISVFVNVGTNVIIDINGYFGSTPNSGAGMVLSTNTGGFTLFGLNVSTTCGGPCGFFSQVFSNSAGVNAMEGFASSTAAPNYGVVGEADGTSSSGLETVANSAGVYGLVTNATQPVSGVQGRTTSSSAHAAGVYGEVSMSLANAGTFRNFGNGVFTFLGTTVAGINYSVFGTGVIHGSNITAPQLGIVTPHPEDASMQISYLAVEAPSADIYFRGTARLANGYAMIEVPDHFRLSARADSYMTTLTPVGARTALFVESEGPNGIEVQGAGNGAFHYVVYAERDVLRDHQPLESNVLYRPDSLDKGQGLDALPGSFKALLIRNGTLNPDGTYNARTAEKLGWTIPPPASVRVEPPAPSAKSR